MNVLRFTETTGAVFAALFSLVFLTAQLAFGGGTPVGVDGSPPTVFYGSPNGIEVGDSYDPIKIWLDPNAPFWEKTFKISLRHGLRTGTMIPVVEHLKLVAPPQPLANLPLTDWHEEIHDRNWQWAEDATLTIHNIDHTQPGVLDDSSTKIWFDWGFPVFPEPPRDIWFDKKWGDLWSTNNWFDWDFPWFHRKSVDIWIEKKLVYLGPDLPPSWSKLPVRIWEHPTSVPEPTSLVLLGVGGLFLISARARRRRAETAGHWIRRCIEVAVCCFLRSVKDVPLFTFLNRRRIMNLKCIATSTAIVFLAAPLAFAAGIPTGVGGDPPTVFLGTPDGIEVGNDENPIEIWLDPNAPFWEKTFEIDLSNGLRTGTMIPVVEHLQLLAPRQPLPNLPLTDWHEEIHDRQWQWADDSTLTIHNINHTQPGERDDSLTKVWFEWGFPVFPEPTLDIWIDKKLVYLGEDIPPTQSLLPVTIWEHPTTVPEPGTFALGGLGMLGMGLVALRRRAETAGHQTRRCVEFNV